jgi:hypothetical protein
MPTPTLKEVDIVQGSSLVVDEKGPVARRRFRVDGLRGQPPAEAQGAALATLASQGAIYYAAAHPGITGIYCNRVAIEPFANGNDSVFATAEYSTPQRNPAAGGGYTVRIMDANGTRSRRSAATGSCSAPVTWTDPSDKIQKKNYVQLEVESSNTVIEITRMARDVTAHLSRTLPQPGQSANAMWGFQSKELLCRGIEGPVLSSGPNNTWLWMVNYRFEGGPAIFAGGGTAHSIWEELSVFRDSIDGPDS